MLQGSIVTTCSGFRAVAAMENRLLSSVEEMVVLVVGVVTGFELVLVLNRIVDNWSMLENSEW